MGKDVSIIIVNYNTKVLLQKCLNSIFKKTIDLNYEVIVVDNASSDGSQQMVKELFPGIILIESAENLGFGKANNLGSTYAEGKYLFFLNSDTYLINNAVKILANFMNVNSQVGICGGNLYDIDLKPNHSYVMFLPSIVGEINNLLLNMIELVLYGKNRQFNHTSKPISVGYITGADLMIRKDLFNSLNGFDPDFFMYYEETELTYRVKKSGYDVYNVPAAQIVHLEGKSYKENMKRLTQKLASRKLYFSKTHTNFGSLCCKIIYFFNLLSRMVGAYLCSDQPKKKEKKMELKIYIKGDY